MEAIHRASPYKRVPALRCHTQRLDYCIYKLYKTDTRPGTAITGLYACIRIHTGSMDFTGKRIF
jgi:hypothetical protein